MLRTRVVCLFSISDFVYDQTAFLFNISYINMEQYNYNYNYDDDDINEQNGLTEGPNSVGMSTTEQIYNTAPVAEDFYVQPVRTTTEEPREESLSPVITLRTS